MEFLDDSHNMFRQMNDTLRDDTNSLPVAKSYYDGMLDEFGIRDEAFRDGYGKLNLTYAFAHSAPNNSTPLLWWPANGRWVPLFER